MRQMTGSSNSGEVIMRQGCMVEAHFWKEGAKEWVEADGGCFRRFMDRYMKARWYIFVMMN